MTINVYYDFTIILSLPDAGPKAPKHVPYIKLHSFVTICLLNIKDQHSTLMRLLIQH